MSKRILLVAALLLCAVPALAGDEPIQYAGFGGLSLGNVAAGAFVNGVAALDADDRIIYDASTGNLLYDADGNGAGAAVQVAVLSNKAALDAGDFLIV